ncbi:MAG: ABC transporter permease subunit [Clostridiales bacterium]|jgi:ABC-type glycerol-3-phosphate transport system permease component|nr:ABC transporter permease subunit [Clostridiales bacterium]
MTGIKRKKRFSFNLYAAIVFVVLVLYSVSLLTVIGWGLLMALKDYDEFNLTGVALPTRLVFRNFITAFDHLFVTVRSGASMKTFFIEDMFLTSLLYAGGCALTQTTVICVTSYCTARYKFFYSKVLTTVVIVTMFIPIVGALPSQIQMAKSTGLYGSVWGLWIMKANFLGMYFLIFQAKFKALPQEFTDAATVDGASHMSVFLKIMLPMASTTFLMVFLLQFISYWNDYMTPLIYMPSSPTMAYGLLLFRDSNENAVSNLPVQVSGAVMLLIPILLIFLLFHRRIYGNLTFGGLKD